MTGTVLILGASGKIGKHSATAFSAAGWTVKTFDRKRDDMNLAARGVDVIVNGLNPPNYHDWENTIPAITRQVIAAARVSGATVIIPGNVYHFGDKPGVWSQRSLPNPVCQKGKIRLDMETAYRESGVQTIVLRAGNFIDPAREGCVMSVLFLRDIKSKKITLPGPHNVSQAMCYLPDWARAAVQLANMRGDLAAFEDIPFPGHTLSAAQLKMNLERLMDVKLRFTNFPWWFMSLASPFWELAHEMKEMRYLWNTDHSLCGERLAALLPDFKPTDLDTVLLSALPDEAKTHGVGAGRSVAH